MPFSNKLFFIFSLTFTSIKYHKPGLFPLNRGTYVHFTLIQFWTYWFNISSSFQIFPEVDGPKTRPSLRRTHVTLSAFSLEVIGVASAGVAVEGCFGENALDVVLDRSDVVARNKVLGSSPYAVWVPDGGEGVLSDRKLSYYAGCLWFHFCSCKRNFFDGFFTLSAISNALNLWDCFELLKVSFTSYFKLAENPMS